MPRLYSNQKKEKNKKRIGKKKKREVHEHTLKGSKKKNFEDENG